MFLCFIYASGILKAFKMTGTMRLYLQKCTTKTFKVCQSIKVFPLTPVKDYILPLFIIWKGLFLWTLQGNTHTVCRSRRASLKWCSIWMEVGRLEEVFYASELWWCIDFSHHLTHNLKPLSIQLVKRVSLTRTLRALNPSKWGTEFCTSVVYASFILMYEVLI